MSTPNPPPEPVSKKKKGCSIVWTVAVLLGLVAVGFAMMAPKSAYFTCRASQSGPKANLTSLYTAQKAFFAEHARYTTDLVALHWRPDGTARYAYGFVVPATTAIAGVADHDPSRRTTLDPRVLALGGYRNDIYGSPLGNEFTQETFDAVAPTATATSGSFVAIAAGNLDSDPMLDVWSIDQDRNFVALRNDCSGEVADGSEGKAP